MNDVAETAYDPSSNTLLGILLVSSLIVEYANVV